MSYKILDCTHGVSEATSDGVVKGVFDECSVSAVGRKVVIAKGRMVLNGVSVLFDGREIIPIPDDYGDGRYYVVGVMKIEGGKPYSFYLSLRDELNLSRSGLDGDLGVVEYLIADVGVSGDKIWARRILPVVNFKNVEKIDAFILKKGFAKGENLNISDAISGIIPQISVCGNCGNIDGKLVGVTDFHLISKTDNLFDVDGLDVRDVGYDDKEGYYVAPKNVWGIVDKIENGFEVWGADMVFSEEARGTLTFHYGNLSAGNYHFGFKAKPQYSYEFSEEERNLSLEVYLDGVKVTRIEGDILENLNVQKDINYPFTLDGDGVVEFKIFLHGYKVQLTDFYLNKDTKADYVDYGYDERVVEIRDKDGNAYELLGTNFVKDEITFDKGECVLIKRLERGVSNEIKTRVGANFISENSIGAANLDGDIEGEPRNVVYELVDYKRIPLSEECVNALTRVKTYRTKTLIDSVGSAVKPYFKINYYKDFYGN